jgi:hypothetical protein
MSKLVRRCIFAGLFLVTAAGRIQVSRTAPPEGSDPVAGFLERQGLTVHKELSPPDQYGTVFSAPGCDRLLNVKTLSISLQEVPLFEAAAGPHDARRYIYLGEIRPTAEPVSLRARWVKHQMLATLGLAPYRQLRTVLFVAEPPGCDAVKRIDWRSFWSTAAASRGSETPTTDP